MVLALVLAPWVAPLAAPADAASPLVIAAPGLSSSDVELRTFRFAPLAFVGAEAGYRWLRLGLELSLSPSDGAYRLGVLPGLSLAIPLQGD